MEQITDNELLNAIRHGSVFIVRNIASGDTSYHEKFNMITGEAYRRGLISWGE